MPGPALGILFAAGDHARLGAKAGECQVLLDVLSTPHLAVVVQALPGHHGQQHGLPRHRHRPAERPARPPEPPAPATIRPAVPGTSSAITMAQRSASRRDRTSRTMPRCRDPRPAGRGDVTLPATRRLAAPVRTYAKDKDERHAGGGTPPWPGGHLVLTVEGSQPPGHAGRADAGRE